MSSACLVHDAVHSSRSYQDPCGFCTWDPQTERILIYHRCGVLESIPLGSQCACLITLSLDTVENVMVGDVDELEEDVG